MSNPEQPFGNQNPGGLGFGGQHGHIEGGPQDIGPGALGVGGSKPIRSGDEIGINRSDLGGLRPDVERGGPYDKEPVVGDTPGTHSLGNKEMFRGDAIPRIAPNKGMLIADAGKPGSTTGKAKQNLIFQQEIINICCCDNY